MAGLVGDIFNLAQQQLPLMARQTALVEIGARPFAAVIKKADVVVRFLQGFDVLRNEAIEFSEICDEIGR